ncbi:ABC transporter permease [Chitinophaga defluvii]|uniref:ABC transporter permease n=1 Tax=Chitinophaga defluvii TaxID=3163343 RepID=A0ABV2T7G2_9BACT
MFRNYFKTAFRNLWRRKTYTALNIAGLALGITCFSLLAMYLHNELTYDRFHKNASNLYRIKMTYSFGGATPSDVALTPKALVPVFKREFPEVVNIVRMGKPDLITLQYGDKVFNERNFLYAEAPFFEMFTFPLLQGDPAAVLKEPNTLVITATAARKYFGNEDPVGKIIKQGNTDLRITGVVADVPENSQLKFDFVGSAPVSTAEEWSPANYYTYVQLRAGASMEVVQQKTDRYVAAMVAKYGQLNKGDFIRYVLEPLTSVHLYSTATVSMEPGNDVRYIYILEGVAILLLLVACINFMNLATARSAERAREIGVRKTMGALRGQLFWQFIAESALITASALLTGILLAKLALPYFNDLTNRSLQMGLAGSSWLYALLMVVFVVVTFIAGTYPALFLSAFRPVTVLKGKMVQMKGGGLRKALVVTQFAASVFFIICTLVIAAQLNYIRHKKIGMERDHVIVLDGSVVGDKLGPLKQALLQVPGIKAVSASYDSPVKIGGGYSLGKVEGKPADFGMDITAMSVAKDFITTMNMEVISGEDFTDADIKDILLPEIGKRHYHFLLNETAAKRLGWSAAAALNKRISMNGRNGTIKGVLKDFHFESMRRAIEPIVIFPEYDYMLSKLLIKTDMVNMKNTAAGMKNAWASFFPQVPFEYHFLNEEFNSLYSSEQRTGNILTLFAVITIFISCLGLFGLAAFTATQRTREIGMRKVMGASVLNIVTLLSRDFLKLVGIAVIVASPLAWYIMNNWLADFAYRTNIAAWVFVVAAGAAVAIALFTISFQSVKAALMNPVKSLRAES